MPRFRPQPGTPKVKHSHCFPLLFAFVTLAANGAPLAGAPGEVRERLQPFGQVCRAGEVCPGTRAERPSSVDGENWAVTDPADSEGQPTGQKGVRSRWVSSGVGWPETLASIDLSKSGGASMRFTHLNLAGGEDSRYGPWRSYWITLGAGERQAEFRVRQPDDSQDTLLLGSGPARFLKRALEDRAGDHLRVQMEYQGKGTVAFRFPLAGAAPPLHAIGMVDRSLVDALARREGEDEPAAAEPEAEAAAPVNALTAAPGTRTGQAIYDTFCFACHATGVSAAPLFGSLEQWQPRIDKGMDDLVATSLAGLNLMPPMGTCMNCTEDEMRDTIAYMIDSAN